MRHGVSSGGGRRFGLHGRRAAAVAGRASRDRGRPRHRRLERGPAGHRRCIRRSPRPTRTSTTRRSTPAAVDGVDVVFLGLPARGVPATGPRARRPGRPRRRPRPPTSACRPAPTSSGTATPTAPRSSSAASPSGCPSCSAPRSRPRPTSPRPAVTRRPRRSRSRRCWRWASSSPPASWWTRRRACPGRGRGLSAPSLFSEANENVAAYGLLTHRHTGEIEHALAHVYGADVQVLFTPHLVPMTRGILATCVRASRHHGPDQRPSPRCLRASTTPRSPSCP